MKYKPQAIAFAITTSFPKWYGGKLQSIKHTDKIRGDLALEFIQKAQNEGYYIVIVDGKSTKTFRKAVMEIDGVYFSLRRGKKRSPGRRQAIRAAAKKEGIAVIITTEAEKTSLLSSIKEIVLPLLENEADIVVPKREQKLFVSSYPKYQHGSEEEGNKLYNEYLRNQGILSERTPDLDLFFGPRAFRSERKIVSLFMKRFTFQVGDITLSREYFDPEQLSNASFFPIVLALKKRLRVRSVEIPLYIQNCKKITKNLVLESFLKKNVVTSASHCDWS